MKKNYVTPAIKAANIVINQIIMTSGSTDPDPKKDVDLPFINTIEEEGVAE